MQFAWILNPILQYAMFALALAASLVFFASIKREVCRYRSNCSRQVEASQAVVEKVVAEVAALRGELDQIRLVPEQTAELTLTRRAQALRMCNRGESAATIAAALRTPRNEIDLLLKLQKLACPPAQTTAATGD